MSAVGVPVAVAGPIRPAIIIIKDDIKTRFLCLIVLKKCTTLSPKFKGKLPNYIGLIPTLPKG